MSKPTPISGFPEWSPPQRMIEQYVLDRIRRTFELYGFSPLETRAVEPLDQLLRKGETSKEVYVIRRLHEEGDAPAGDDTLGLHFDLTVPFARYVLENAGKLQFPFRRYQIQKVWRGERPQEGRYREFVQADIDIVDRDTLPAHYEAEMPLVIGDALRGLPIPPVRIQVNNRKICEGFYRGIGLTDPEAALRAVDKLDKIGPAKVADLLAETAGATRGTGEGLPGAGGDLRCQRLVRRRHPGPRREQPAARRGRRRTGRRWWRPPPSTPPASAWRICASPAASTTTPAPSTRPSCSGTRSSARSAPAAGTTTSPPPAPPASPAWASRSA